jgi:hypothetical protein
MKSPEGLRGEALRRAWLDASYSVTLREEMPRADAMGWLLGSHLLAIVISLAAVCTAAGIVGLLWWLS